MTRNFRISVHRNSENLHLKLMGDFDGTSARELLAVLKKYSNRTSTVFIHTACLRNIYPFGVSEFQSNLGVLKGKPVKLVFTGENASQLAPERRMVFDLIISIMWPVADTGTTMLSPSPRRPE